MSNTTAYPHGTFSWADLRTTDGPAATEFYTNLFGWEAIDYPVPGGGVYTMMQQDGQDVCALSEMSPDQKAQGMPPVWNSYITVDDVDAMAEKVMALGGNLIAPPFDVMDNGRMTVIQDPTGAMVSLWQAYQHKGAGIFNIPNTMNWNELATRDVDTAKNFYSNLLGWETETDERNHTLLMNNGRPNGGMIEMNEQWGDAPPHWSVYFSVADSAATADQIRELGGNVLHGPFSAGEVGMIAVVQDPLGTVFHIVEMNQIETTMP